MSRQRRKANSSFHKVDRSRNKSEGSANQIVVPQRPRPNISDAEEWKAYWTALGWLWRTEPEIEVERQKDLAKRCENSSSIKRGIYPFSDIEPNLNRADIEWLLANHEHGRGPIDWSDKRQRERKGLDLRGADLSQVDLQGLPLACIVGGIKEHYSQAEREMAAIHLEEANLRFAHLEGAKLVSAHLEGADLSSTCLVGAVIGYAHLKGAWLVKTQMNEAFLGFADLEGAHLIEACLNNVNLIRANLERTNLLDTQLRKAILCEAHLEGASLTGVHLEGADLGRAHLGGNSKLAAVLYGVFFDASTNLRGVSLGDIHSGFVSLCDVHWGDVNLSVVGWSMLEILGDEST